MSAGAQDAPSQRIRIGDYFLAEEIGKGSFATVYKGYRAVRIVCLPTRIDWRALTPFHIPRRAARPWLSKPSRAKS